VKGGHGRNWKGNVGVEMMEIIECIKFSNKNPLNKNTLKKKKKDCTKSLKHIGVLVSLSDYLAVITG
jgi:hypothetical protein